MKKPTRKLILIATAATAFGLSVGVGFGLQVPGRELEVTSGSPTLSTSPQEPSSTSLTGSQFLGSAPVETKTGPAGFPLAAETQPHGGGSQAARRLIEERGMAWLVATSSLNGRSLRTVAVYSAEADITQIRSFYEGNPPGTPWYLTAGHDTLEFANGSTGDSAIVQFLDPAQTHELGVPANSFALLIFG